MKIFNICSAMAICFALSIMGCKAPSTETAAAAEAVDTMAVAMPDLAKIKAEIQAINNEWAMASNAKDIAKILAIYSDDAVSMSNNKPMMVGKAAIQKDSETWFAKHKEGSTVAYETLDVFGNDQLVTETGTITTKDATGKVTYTGKYMGLWEKRDGKWLCIRDISNDDVKEK